ncbi:MAG: magnesium transporter [Planctomycetota bacterium]
MAERERLVELAERLEGIEGSVPTELSTELAELPVPDLAALLDDLPAEQSLEILQDQDPVRIGEVLVELSDPCLDALVPLFPAVLLSRVLVEASPDDATDLYGHTEEEDRPALLRLLDEPARAKILHLAAYDEESAGGIMTPEFVAVPADATLADALDRVRRSEDLETDQIYAIDKDGRPAGVVSLQEILQQDDLQQRVDGVMEPLMASVRDTDDREEALRIATHYGLSTVPVVDAGERLVGIVTSDDLDYVHDEEASEDLMYLAGTMVPHPTRLGAMVRIAWRVPQLLVTFVTCLAIAMILDHLVPVEEGGGRYYAAIRYLPLVIALAGNVGTIVNAIVVRGLATSELDATRFLVPMLDELKVGLGVGLVSASVSWFGVGLVEGWGPLSASVAAALVLSPLLSGLAGFLIPIMAHRIGRDPALAGPLVTNFNDLSGTIVYVLICLTLL